MVLLSGLTFSESVSAQTTERKLTGAEVQSPYPLKPPELDSPRATLQSFIKYANEAISLWFDEKSGEAINRVLRRAMLCLDLSEVPIATREKTGTEKVLLLKEILDRVEVPPFEEIPDANTVERSGLKDWTIPNTELTITKLEEGPRSGAFVVSIRTVALLNQFYKLAESLPYKRGATIGAYEDFLYGPGPLLPRAWLDDLPPWAYKVIGEQTVWQWLSLISLLVISGLVIFIVYRVGKWWDQRYEDASIWLRFGGPLTALFAILTTRFTSHLVDDAINITGITFVSVEILVGIATFLAAAWLAALVITWLGESIITARRLRSSGLNSQMVRILARLVAILAVAYIVIVATESFGIPIAPLIAGLGVGGLAIALAVRPTMENIVGGFILFADRPVRVGDFCSFGDKTGTVEQVGLRSTRIRALDRTVISIPNAVFANMEIVNWASCDRMLIDKTIGLRYETKSEQLRFVLVKLREMFFSHPKIDQDSARIRFIGYGVSSQDIRIRVYALTRDWNEFYAVQEDVMLRVGEIVEESGSGFAFPSQTVYYGNDEGIDEERSRFAVEQVQSWRSAQHLPFPQMDPSRREKLANTLDYPPRGSPDAHRTDKIATEHTEPLSTRSLEQDEQSENPQD